MENINNLELLHKIMCEVMKIDPNYRGFFFLSKEGKKKYIKDIIEGRIK